MPVPSYPAAFRRAFDLGIVLALITSWQGQATAQDPVLELSAPPDQSELTIHHPDVSPDGQYLAVSAGTTFSNSTIWVFNRQTESLDQLTSVDDQMNVGDVCARWSPDGQSILFVSDRGEGLGIYLVDIATHSTRLMHKLNLKHLAWWAQADWSPDGSEIIFPDQLGDNQNLFSYRISDGHIEQVTEEQAVRVMFPAWSPDGHTIPL